jgi:hypothetical protein
MSDAHRRLWSFIFTEARDTAMLMRLSWRHISRSPSVERMALSNAVTLERLCEVAVGIVPATVPAPMEPMCPGAYESAIASRAIAELPILPLPHNLGTPKARYDVEAACRTIPRLFPYSPLDFPDLRDAVGYDMDKRRDKRRETELFAVWHNWMWDTTFAVPESSETAANPDRKDFGQSSELAWASARLAGGLKVALGL